jgi:hypothetical protein
MQSTAIPSANRAARSSAISITWPSQDALTGQPSKIPLTRKLARSLPAFGSTIRVVISRSLYGVPRLHTQSGPARGRESAVAYLRFSIAATRSAKVTDGYACSSIPCVRQDNDCEKSGCTYALALTSTAFSRPLGFWDGGPPGDAGVAREDPEGGPNEASAVRGPARHTRRKPDQIVVVVFGSTAAHPTLHATLDLSERTPADLPEAGATPGWRVRMVIAA